MVPQSQTRFQSNLLNSPICVVQHFAFNFLLYRRTGLGKGIILTKSRVLKDYTLNKIVESAICRFIYLYN